MANIKKACKQAESDANDLFNTWLDARGDEEQRAALARRSDALVAKVEGLRTLAIGMERSAKGRNKALAAVASANVILDNMKESPKFRIW